MVRMQAESGVSIRTKLSGAITQLITNEVHRSSSIRLMGRLSIVRSSLVFAAVATLGATIALAFAPLWLAGLLLAALMGAVVLESRQRVSAAAKAPQNHSVPTSHPALEPVAADLVSVYSPSRDLKYVSPSVAEVLGWSRDEFMELRLDELVHPDHLPRLTDAFEAVGAVLLAQATLSLQVRTPHTWRDVEVTVTNAIGIDDIDGFVVRQRDISVQRHLEALLDIRSREMRSLAALADHALVGSDEATLIQAAVVDAREAMSASAIEVYRVAKGALELSAGVGPAGISLDRRSTTISGSSLASEATALESTVFAYSESLPHLATAVAIPIVGTDSPRGALVARSSRPREFDDTDLVFLRAIAGLIALAGRQRGAEQDAFRRSRHDDLTGLVNRDVFLERLENSVARSSEPGQMLGVLLIDVDHFKIINDSLGHTAGDALIEALSDRLTQALRPGDTLARFGGDEFVVLTRALSSPEQAILGARRMQSVLNRPFAVAGHDVQVTASIGVAVCADASTESETVMQQADAALYRAKELGRERVEMFEPAMLERAITRLRTEEELREALAANQLRVFYQPIVDLASGQTHTVEALVRWVHPARGLVAPSEFIPISEATGLIEEIGAWVINEACRQIKAWSDDGNRMQVSVNVSARQVADPGLLRTIDDALDRHQVDASMLAIELTESILTSDVARTEETLTALHDRGITIAIDDFGTGHSSMSYLRTLPIDVVKIDRALVGGIDRSGEDYSVVAAMIQLAQALGKEVVAGGVETEQQLELLRDLGCSRAQGFLFSPAVFEIDYGTEDHLWTDLVLDDRR